MTTIALLFVGQFFVFADYPRLGTIDIVPDPIGWGLTAVALLRLRHHSALFGWAAALTVVAGVLSVVDWVYPLSELPGSINDKSVISLLELGNLLDTQAVYDLTTLAILEMTALGLILTSTRAGDRRAARQFGALAVALVAVEVLATVAVGLVIVGALTVSLATMLLILKVVTLAVHGWWVFVLYLHRDAPWGHHALTPAEVALTQQPVTVEQPASA